MQVFWHRRDLRVADNVGLAAATGATPRGGPAADTDAAGPVVPLFCLDDEILRHAGAPRVAFVLDALDALRADYRARGSDLLVRHGDASTVVPTVADEYDADRVSWNRDYSGLAEERDDAVRAALSDDGVAVATHHDAVLHEPGTIRTNDGDPYSVYAYFWKKWRDRETDDPAPPPPQDGLAAVADETPLPDDESLGFQAPDADLPAAGTGPARRRLSEFLAADVYRYADARDTPSAAATSRLSQDLTFGTVGIREVDDAVLDALAAASDDAERESVETYRSQLAWREFYTQVLWFNQSTVTDNHRDFANPIDWRNDPDELAAWTAGETGYPIVDAGMRQLASEAYVHNRVRMLVASFLTKDLLWDWRAGYRHFREHLVDHDTANDVGGWQWAASTGTDAQPYFRVFNPQTQGERYDPDAAYIREYVPELADVDPETIHAWPDLDPAERTDAAPAYPAPIVDHAARREAAIATFEAATGSD